jgi:hypothetical protein
MKLLKSKKSNVDYEQLYHDSQQKLSWYIEALEQKQIQSDILESELLKIKKENAKLLAQVKSILDLPKQLGKNLGK